MDTIPRMQENKPLLREMSRLAASPTWKMTIVHCAATLIAMFRRCKYAVAMNILVNLCAKHWPVSLNIKRR